MDHKITIIYANRDRSYDRIKISLDSLERQTEKNFKVVFVDYGSNSVLQSELKELCSHYQFIDFYPLNVSQLLWNKSKALNFGILQCKTSFIFIADVDLVFHYDSIKKLNKIASTESFYLFNLAYLSENESKKLKREFEFEDLKPSNVGDVNGMILAPKTAFMRVDGFDEFFHFYGGEDVDLFARIGNAGFKERRYNHSLFYHNWHQGFSGSEDKVITSKPRVKNIMRINQEHYLSNKRFKRIRPLRQDNMGELIDPMKAEKLKHPDHIYKILNVKAHVEHFLNEELKSVSGVVQAYFEIDNYYHSTKHRIKKVAGRQTQPYISLKEVNDMVLKKIVFDFRDLNYSYRVSDNLQRIDFRIEL